MIEMSKKEFAKCMKFVFNNSNKVAEKYYNKKWSLFGYNNFIPSYRENEGLKVLHCVGFGLYELYERWGWIKDKKVLKEFEETDYKKSLLEKTGILVDRFNS